MRSRNFKSIRQLTHALTGGNCQAVIVMNKSKTVGSTVGNVVASVIRSGAGVTFKVVPGNVNGSFTGC